MQHLDLYIPGLFWPGADPAILADLALPALRRLFGPARFTHGPGLPAHQRYSGALGIQADGEGPLRRCGEPDLPAPEHGVWLCADPVQLFFAREHLLVGLPDALQLNPGECRALEAPLREQLRPFGDFVLTPEGRGYLRCVAAPDVRFETLDDVAGRPLALFLPRGPEARAWLHLTNALQVLLHEHPVNRAREAAGLPLANSLWFWGMGTLPNMAPPRTDQVFTDSVLARGQARCAGLTARSLEAFCASPAGGRVLVDALFRPQRYRDALRWREALTRLDATVFGALAEALRSGALRSATVQAATEVGTLDIALRRRSWRWWGRKPDLSCLIQPAPGQA